MNPTDDQIRAFLETLPAGHYARQWCIDALTPSASHRHRQSNARREIARLMQGAHS